MGNPFVQRMDNDGGKLGGVIRLVNLFARAENPKGAAPSPPPDREKPPFFVDPVRRQCYRVRDAKF